MPDNYPLSYKLSWLPRFLHPSLDGSSGHPAPDVGRSTPDSTPEQFKKAALRPQLQQNNALSTRLVFLGDISAIASDRPPIIDRALRDHFASAQLVVANCESPVVARVLKQPGSFLGIRHAMKRQFLSGVLEAANIPADRLVLSLANNHALDQGQAGLHETMHTLADLGIRTVGDMAGDPVRKFTAGPLTIGIAAFTEWRNASLADFTPHVMTSEAFDRDGWAALRQSDADLLCAVPHWDREFRHFPQPATRTKARKLAENGVSLIVGSHAHVVQPIQHVDGALVAYGLGDFLGTAWRHCRWPLRLGAMLVVNVTACPSAPDRHSGKIVSYEGVPFVRQRENGRERLIPIETVPGSRGKAFKTRWNLVLNDRQEST